MIMVYPEEPFWASPQISGLYDDGDYRGEIYDIDIAIIV